MAAQYQIIFDPGTSVIDLQSIKNRLMNMEPMILNMGVILSKHMIDKWGTGWPPLSPATMLLKSRMGYPDEPLVRTGALKGAVESAEWQASRRGMSEFVGILEVPGYGRFHAEGTRFMPARDFTFIADDVESDIANAAEDWIFGGVLG
jgi:hypothetical protein